MKSLQWWLICCGGAVIGALISAVGMSLAGLVEGARVAFDVAIGMSVVGLLYAALMAGIIVWCEVRAGVTLEHSPRSEAVPSAASQSRATFYKGVR